MRSGKLRNRITIQKPDDAASGWGGATTYSTYATVWASIKPITGKETLALRQDVGEVTHLVTCRYLANVTPSMRISFQGKYYDILFVKDIDTRHHELQMEVKEIV